MSWRKILKFFKKRRSYTDAEIYPDEIFLDARNLPKFDVNQFEGRLEKPIPKSVPFVLGGLFFLFVVVYVSQIWVLQVKRGEAFAERSENNRLRHTSIFSNRGIIYDRNGIELASNVINPNEPDFAERVYAPIKGIAHVVGYLKYPTKDSAGFYYKTEYDGKDGAEKIFNSELSGENGTRIVETNALGQIKSESVVVPSKDGKHINLSIDSGIQNEMYKAIENASEKYGFKGGAGLIMDIYTGELIAITSFPEYNSNIMTNGRDKDTISGYQKNTNNPFLNRAVSGLYTPGSIVKPYVALAALSEKIISPNKKILSTGSISIQNPYNPEQKTVFMDWRPQGWVDMREAIAVSSNVYFYAVGGGFEDQKGLGITNIEKYLKMMGLDEKTNINLLGEVSGTIPNPKWKQKVFNGDAWRLGDTYHTSIGQYGFQMTPIEAVRSVAAIANNGTLLQPTILMKKPNEPIINSKTVPIKDEYFKIVKEGMRQAVFTVTTGALNLPYVSVAAKTGTAEIGAAKLFVNSWVTGFFPYENPRYAFALIMEKGARTNQLGATYVMRDVFEWMNIYRPEYLQD
jgi:penicillin-binding protein 2